MNREKQMFLSKIRGRKYLLVSSSVYEEKKRMSGVHELLAWQQKSI